MHAVLITAYADFASLARLVQRLDRDFFRLYVHIDRKSTIGSAQMQELTKLGCYVEKRFRIRWGSFTHLAAIIRLLKQAVAEGGLDYIHIISGQDYPLYSSEEFERRCDGRIFLSHARTDAVPEDIKERYQLRNLFWFLQGAPRPVSGLYRYLDPCSRNLQKAFWKPRSHVGPYASIYKGMVWSSFPMMAARTLIEDSFATQLLAASRTTYLPEEFYFQTYFMNSDLKERVVNDDLRFMDWAFRNGSVPAFLDLSHADALTQSEALFGRKISSKFSIPLLDWVDRTRFG